MKTTHKVLIGAASLTGLYFLYRHFNGRMISKKGITFLTMLEGKRNKAYKDSKGLDTIGVGHLIKPTEKTLLTKTLTDKEVQKLFDKDLDRFEKVVHDSIKVPLVQWQKDALVSLAFNIGETGFKKSSLVRSINAKSSDEIIKKNFSAWDNPPELKERRAKEIRLFLEGIYSPLISSTEFNKYYRA